MQGITMTGITKDFFGKLALQDVGITLKKGTVHAIVGENGAGKITLKVHFSDTDSVVRIRYDSDYETRHDQTEIRSLSWRLVPRNLAYRCLSIQRFAHVARRKPGCRHVRHFSVRLANNEPAQDLSIISAQLYFRYLGRDR